MIKTSFSEETIDSVGNSVSKKLEGKTALNKESYQVEEEGVL